jgi:hypothetical protein
MRIPRWVVVGAVVAVATVASGAALGAGPWPGLAQTVVDPAGQVRYVATRADGSTTVKARRVGDRALLASQTFDGAYGIPAVTSNGLAGGLSPDGRVLVLVEPPSYQGLREQSRFLVVSTDTLSLSSTIVLRGEFGFDALSPDGRTLYLVQHASRADLVSYVVRAYDLRARRLLPGAIVDRREPDETMRGYPVARATSPGGSWVYTLYSRGTSTDKPFVHALNAARRTAFCIDLPSKVAAGNVWSARLELANGGRELVVRSGSGAAVARVDTKTLRVR